MGIEYMSIGKVGWSEEEKTLGYIGACQEIGCGRMGEEMIRVDGMRICVRCAANRWEHERRMEGDPS
jgi:hypothetical protein